jgi:hypothetical protein
MVLMNPAQCRHLHCQGSVVFHAPALRIPRSRIRHLTPSVISGGIVIILLIVLILLFGFGGYRMGPGIGYYGGGSLSLILLIILVLLLLRVI